MRQAFVVGTMCCAVGLVAGLVVGAARRDATPPMAQMFAMAPSSPEPVVMEASEGGEMLRDDAAKEEEAPGVVGGKGSGYGRGGGGLSMKRMETIQIIRGSGGGMAAPAPKPTVAAPAEAPEAGGSPSRAWFPETFLFEPLVVTDASGAATVPVRVPDRLTQWRVLALAHSRSGAQAGTVTRFAGTLPTYVDPVLPGFLRAGDVVRLPVQVVNTTASAVEQTLKVTAVGATLEGGERRVRVPARGSVVEYVTLRASQPGAVTVNASLGGADAVSRGFEVQPTGRPVLETRGGSLAAPRTISLVGPAEAMPGSERVRLQVYPGALGVLRSELSVAARRTGLAEDAYVLLLAGRAPELLKALGEEADAEVLKGLSLTAGQRVLRASRAPAVSTAALLAEATLAHPGNPVLARLGERMAARVAQAQRPDGTCQGEDGWTLQRLLVATSECTQAVRAASASASDRQRAVNFTVRAAGAFERNLTRVQDGYTAAALLASGAVTAGPLQEALRERVREALKKREDGSAYLPVESGVVRGDGTAPPEVEATALAVLALQGDAKAPMADLGASLLAGYSPVGGWGDGRTNLTCLRAALALFKDPLPTQVRVVLERDGKPVTEGTLDAKALRDVLALEASVPGSAGAHAWTVRAEPAVPGLGFTLTLGAHVPWKVSESRGLELAVKGPSEGKVGQPVELTLQAATPQGIPLSLRYGLPAGMQVEVPSVQALVNAERVTSFDLEDGAVTLHLPPRSGTEPFIARIRVVPTLAGTLQGGASWLAPEARPDATFYVPPVTWAVR
ncbi:alpha-2-macroglobulin family protein [Myxococcaceae bacterium GXIMD 01537]